MCPRVGRPLLSMYIILCHNYKKALHDLPYYIEVPRPRCKKSNSEVYLLKPESESAELVRVGLSLFFVLFPPSFDFFPFFVLSTGQSKREIERERGRTKRKKNNGAEGSNQRRSGRWDSSSSSLSLSPHFILGLFFFFRVF